MQVSCRHRQWIGTAVSIPDLKTEATVGRNNHDAGTWQHGSVPGSGASSGSGLGTSAPAGVAARQLPRQGDQRLRELVATCRLVGDVLFHHGLGPQQVTGQCRVRGDERLRDYVQWVVQFTLEVSGCPGGVAAGSLGQLAEVGGQ